ncbi:uncharacterized protein LOC122303729 [Carya illinoinensis]|uniref:uncharacterized protein LOC122303729 n=1 Tax=Carya illinoinensis TaxID=32201 RepID=UPI001C71817F|nr:uncharacterized protein LOC122303729 [Carya illinoinensis]
MTGFGLASIYHCSHIWHSQQLDFRWSSDIDDVEIVTSRNCPQGIVNEAIEDETVEEQCDVSIEDGLDVGDDVNLGDGDGDGVNEGDGDGDGVNVRDGDGINLISTSSSGNLEPFVGKEFDEVEDAQGFYKAYARRGLLPVFEVVWTLYSPNILLNDGSLESRDYDLHKKPILIDKFCQVLISWFF